MKPFMDKDFLLETDTAKRLFHDYSEKQPLIDYHCHISPREIYENRRFNNLVEVLLGGKNPDVTYFDPVEVGTYYYELTLEYEYEGETCTSDPVVTSVEVTSVDEMSAGFNLYPNPANDKLTVESAVEMKEVRIYNLLGGLVRSIDQAGYKMEISLEGMPNGLYFIQMVSNDNTISKRFIKK